MATHTLLEINGDYINDCDPTKLGMLVQMAVRNPDAYKHYRTTPTGQGSMEVRALRYVCTKFTPIPVSVLQDAGWINEGRY